MGKQLGNYILARSRERSSVAAVAAVVMAAFGLHASPDTVSQVVNAVVIVAGLVTMAVPGGK